MRNQIDDKWEIYLKLLQQRINVWCRIEKKLSGLLNPGFYNTEFLLHFLSVPEFLSSLSPLGPGLCQKAAGKKKKRYLLKF